ncbi:DUF3267 domain-containing protein [Aquibacillus koreensis]|uniref:DUF3267 domain-containing protein n=1 Tax=Aquibacillus koreensis TaxID=279446 RepID=A0A9X3WK82_9BACI|nr:DUF3267 domain-containing protein [Aquibacillus koreensis]MCT2535562.1 DUF3267 domain-containing protein [Aquibacillus koreensis]MDC3420153.1 DUF3267 domain-containing protein [Aquibacillus koreensis]
MNCWKTVNVYREVGINRIYIISLLLGLLSFIFLYIPFSIVHQSNDFKDHGLFPLLFGLALLPLVHKLMHIVPLIIANRKVKLKWQLKMGMLPVFFLSTKTKMSKQTSIITLLAPTLFITIPGLVSSYLFADYFAYFLILTAINIGLSFTDYIYVAKLLRAPKKCIVENDDDGYDILVN